MQHRHYLYLVCGVILLQLYDPAPTSHISFQMVRKVVKKKRLADSNNSIQFSLTVLLILSIILKKKRSEIRILTQLF